MHYEELNENIKKETKKNINQKYCIINKEFMRIYKEYYNYQNIINILLNEPNVKSEFLKYKNNINYCIKNKINYDQFISPIIQNFREGNVLELGLKREKQDNNLVQNLFNNKDAKVFWKSIGEGKILNYYEENEILNIECIELLTKIESEQIKKLVNKNDIYCLIGENKIFITIQDFKNYYYYLDIGHLNNNIFTTDLIIYYYNYNNLNAFIEKIKNESFNKFISFHIKALQEKAISSILNINNQIEGKIIKIKDLIKIYSLDRLNDDNNSPDIENVKKSQIQKKFFSIDDKLNDNFNNKFEENLNLNKSKLEEENNKLKDELNNYKRENEKLKKEINKLKEDNMKLNSELINAKKIIINLNHIQENNQDNIKIINNLNELIQVKNKEINDLEMKLIDKGKNNRLVNYDDIFFVHFISKDEKISCGIKCLKTDTFSKVEEKFYEKYPEYRETNNQFLLRGKSILRDKKICEIFIKDSEMILFINT